MRHLQDAETGGAGRGRGYGLLPQGRQLQVLSTLWELGSATVARLQIALNGRYEPEIAYNTVLTYLRTLVRRRFVTVELLGAAYLYSPAIRRDHARWLEIQRITDLLFDGSREELLIALVTDRLTHRTALVRARDAIERRLATSAGPAARHATPGPPSGRSAASSPGSRRPSP